MNLPQGKWSIEGVIKSIEDKTTTKGNKYKVYSVRWCNKVANKYVPEDSYVETDVSVWKDNMPGVVGDKVRMVGFLDQVTSEKGFKNIRLGSVGKIEVLDHTSLDTEKW